DCSIRAIVLRNGNQNVGVACQVLANVLEPPDYHRVKKLSRIKPVCCVWIATVSLGVMNLLADPITLPAPIFFENFTSVAEGGLPAGWYQTNYSTRPEATFDLQNLNSASYATWVVVERARFASNFSSYSSHAPVDYSRVMSFNPNNVVNGQTVTNLAIGRFVFSTSGYRDGNQVMYLFTPDFNLSGRTN